MILSLHAPGDQLPCHDKNKQDSDDNSIDDGAFIRLVGGKAASLMKLYATPGLSSHVPQGFCLTVDFFAPWMDQVMAIPEWQQLHSPSKNSTATETELMMHQCSVIKAVAKNLALNDQQSAVLTKLKEAMMQDDWPLAAAAVRSSAPEEDGSLASFAGLFETRLGVSCQDLEGAIRHCFASRFDYRVFQYASSMAKNTITPTRTATTTAPTTRTSNTTSMGFAVIVMEMVDSCVAGVAFSVNPINSDLDELVVDSAYGLGEVVVDGSVEADHYVYDKVAKKVIHKKTGCKQQEKRLVHDISQGDDGQVSIETKDVDTTRQTQSSLSDDQLYELARLVCCIETANQQAVDVEWAFARDNNNNQESLQLKLLQARPITTNFQLDDRLLTKPGERRVLYYDFNIASEATTMTPFTHMDLAQYSKMSFSFISDYEFIKYDPRLPIFNASTRQYCNLSLFLRFWSPQYFADQVKFLDSYLADLFASSDCDRERYRARRKDWPKELNLRNAFWLFRQLPLLESRKVFRKFSRNPEASKLEYMQLVKANLARVEEVGRRGMRPEEGLAKYIQDLYDAVMPLLKTELFICLNIIVPLFRKLDTKRREGKTPQERNDYDALCGGYEGDELMEMNIAMYQMARKLPISIWQQYDSSTFDQLGERIQANLNGLASGNDEDKEEGDLPEEFLLDWISFMDKHGYDGQDQMFVSSARHNANPAILIAKLRHCIGDGILDPAVAQQQNLDKRRKVMERHEMEARRNICIRLVRPFNLSSIRRRNAILDHVMWIRSSPKLHVARVVGMIRQELLKIEKELIASGRLEQEGDIFHLDVGEVDSAIMSNKKSNDHQLNLMELVRPRKAIYERAVRSKQCPLLVDSRCRILKRDVKDAQQEPGTLVGSPVGAPGVVASARVRIVHHPTDPLQAGEVLVATVTDPAWTPMFAGAAAIILQIGGALQHGALCAREYGKPAVSGIDVMTHLKTGMMVSVDGNTGIVKILQDDVMAEEQDTTHNVCPPILSGGAIVGTSSS